MDIPYRANGGSYLVEMVPHEYGIAGEHRLGERIYGPYHFEHQIQTALKAIKASLPPGNKMNVLELGGERRVWWLTGERKEFKSLATATAEELNNIFGEATARAAQEALDHNRGLGPDGETPGYKDH